MKQRKAQRRPIGRTWTRRRSPRRGCKFWAPDERRPSCQKYFHCSKNFILSKVSRASNLMFEHDFGFENNPCDRFHKNKVFHLHVCHFGSHTIDEVLKFRSFSVRILKSQCDTKNVRPANLWQFVKSLKITVSWGDAKTTKQKWHSFQNSTKLLFYRRQQSRSLGAFD